MARRTTGARERIGGGSLHRSQIRDRFGTTGMPGDVYSIDDLEARVAKMRALGVTRWGDIELGPEPTAPSDADDMTQRSRPDDVAKAVRAEKHRVAALASGGPVPAVGRTQ